MIKYLALLALLFSPLGFAKPILKSEGPSGYLVLYDDKCPIDPNAFYLKAFKFDGTLVFDGCWIELDEDNIIAVKFPDNATGILPKKNFKIYSDA